LKAFITGLAEQVHFCFSLPNPLKEEESEKKQKENALSSLQVHHQKI
jgi:hypothetical protein